MKTTIKTMAFLALVVAMSTACKKNYECHCDKTAGGAEHYEIKAKNKGDAESDCKQKASSGSGFSKCELE